MTRLLNLKNWAAMPFWTNFEIEAPDEKIETVKVKELSQTDQRKQAKQLGFEFDKLPDPDGYGRHKVLNNTITPKIGKVILESALSE